MPKNTIGGSGHKKSKKIVTLSNNTPFKEDGCDYAFVLDTLGGGRMRLYCYTDKCERIGHIRGNMYKKVWICKEDVVLVSLREFEKNKCDIVYKYDEDDIKQLIKTRQLDKTYSGIAKQEKNSLHENIVIFEDECNIDIDNI